MQEINCAICAGRQKTTVLYEERIALKKISGKIYSARRTPDGMHHRFVKCANCGLIFSNPILPSREIEKFYKKSSFNYGSEVENIKATYYSYFQNLLIQNQIPIHKKLRILDIGCGNGFFLESLVDNGFKNVYGVEPGKQTVAKARKDIKPLIKTDILKPGIFRSGSFDIITCFQTLDHIAEIETFLNLVKKLLKKGGRVLFIVHDTEGLSVKILGEKSPIFDIEHIYLFNKSNLEKLFYKVGFKKLQIFNIKNKYSLSYWIQMLPLSKLIIEIVKNTPIGRLPITFKAGNIGVVASR